MRVQYRNGVEADDKHVAVHYNTILLSRWLQNPTATGIMLVM